MEYDVSEYGNVLSLWTPEIRCLIITVTNAAVCRMMCRKHDNTSVKLAEGNTATLDDYQALATSSGEIKSAQTKGTDNLASPDGGELIAASLARRVSFRGGS